MQQHRPYWHMKVVRYCNSFSGSIPPNSEHNYLAIDKHLEKLPLQFYDEICHDQECNDMGFVIATKWRHCLFYLQQYFSALETVLTKSFTEAFCSNSRLDVREVKTETVRMLLGYFGMKFLSLEIMIKKENLDVWPLSNLELVNHFFIFRPTADAICHTLFYERRWF